MLGYMEVVCLILGPMLASQPCSHALWVLTSIHLLLFIENVFIILDKCNIVIYAICILI